MSGKLIGIGSLFAVCLGLAAWALRPDPHPDANPASELAGPELHIPTQTGRPQAPATPVPNSTQPKQEGTGQEIAAVAELPRELDVPQYPPRSGGRNRELIAKLFRPPAPTSTEQELQAWEDSPLDEYLHPPGHPCAGQPRSKVSPSALTDAGNAVLGPIIDTLPDVDKPQCYLSGNWPYRPVNQCARSLDREDPASVEAFIDCLDALPQDPKAYPAEVWLPCPPGDPRTTTVREHLEGLLRAQVDEIFTAPPCEAE